MPASEMYRNITCSQGLLDGEETCTNNKVQTIITYSVYYLDYLSALLLTYYQLDTVDICKVSTF